MNNLPVRVDVDARRTAARPGSPRLQQRQFEIAQHQYAPLEQIQQWAGIPWRYRLFDSLVVFQNYQVDADARRIGHGCDAPILLAAPEATNYPLTLTVTARRAHCASASSSCHRCSCGDVQQFAADLSIVLAGNGADSRLHARRHSVAAASRIARKADELAPADSAAAAASSSAPTNEAERAIAAVWQELFGVERVSLDDNFFDLGGHSLLLVQAHARLKSGLRADLPIVALLQYPTIRSLARHLTGGPSSAPSDSERAIGSRPEAARGATAPTHPRRQRR